MNLDARRRRTTPPESPYFTYTDRAERARGLEIQAENLVYLETPVFPLIRLQLHSREERVELIEKTVRREVDDSVPVG